MMQDMLDPETFQLKTKIVQKQNDGEIVTLYEGVDDEAFTKPKYTPEEQRKIDRVNRLLKEEGHNELTEDEIKFLLDTAGMAKRLEALEKKMQDPKVLQRMAGFKVEKVITPID